MSDTTERDDDRSRRLADEARQLVAVYGDRAAEALAASGRHPRRIMIPEEMVTDLRERASQADTDLTELQRQILGVSSTSARCGCCGREAGSATGCSEWSCALVRRP